MLNWTGLSVGKKICGAMLAILCAMVGVIGAVVVQSVVQALMWLGLVLFLAGVISVPAVFEARAFSQVRMSDVPALSKALVGSGVLLAYLGLFFRFLTR